MAAFTLFPDHQPGVPVNSSLLKQQREQGYHVLESFRNNPPGFWTDNKYEETNHDIGVTYIAIRAIMDAVHCATVTLGRKKRKNPSTSFLSGDRVTKSLPSQQSGSSQHEDYQTVVDHPVCRLIDKPNPVDTFGQLLSYLALQNRLTGTAPLWTIPNMSAKPTELYALPTALTTPQWQKTPEFPTGAWRIQPYYASGGMGYLPSPFAGTGVIVPNHEIQRFMDPHPFFRHDGKSPQAACAFQLDVLQEIDQARWAAFDHGVTMDAVLQVDGFDDGQINRIEAKMEQKHMGTRNHRRFLILSGPLAGQNKVNLQSFSNSPKEMDFNQSWEQMVGFVLAVFGVPKSVAGLGMASSYSELYAALRQFYQRQKAYIYRLAEFLTKALCWPYCKIPGEYRINIDLPTLDDPDLQEKQLSTDLQANTITFNEARAIRNRAPVEGGDVPVSIYLAMKQQEMAPEPAPMMPGMEQGGEPQPGAEGEQGEQPPDEQTVMDDVTREAFEKLGVPWEEEQGQEENPELMKARGAPKPRPMPKSGIFTDKRGRKYRLENGKRVAIGNAAPSSTQNRFTTRRPDEEAARQLGHDEPPATTPFPSRIAGEQSSGPQPSFRGISPQSPRGVASSHDRAPKPAFKSAAAHATATPEGKAIIARAKEWAGRQADKHADKVAAHLGISRLSAHFLLRTTIEHLCREALATGEGAAKTHTGATGKKLTIGIRQKPKGKGPTSGAAPHPENPAAFGSRPPLQPKAMSAYQAGIGAELVPPALPDSLIPLKRPGSKNSKRRQVKYLNRLVKGLSC